MKRTHKSKTSLQVNLHFGDHTISACGMFNKEMKLVTANNFPTLLRKIKKLGIKVENLILTFQPE